VQAFAAAGYVVALVNFHGSASYGQAWANSILGDWGGKPAQDLLLATDHLIARGFVDPARVAIAGGSFGGYMACWLASQTGTEIDVGGEPWGGLASRAAITRFDPASFSQG